MRAMKELETALALKPDDYDTLVSLGFAYRQKSDLPKAIAHLKKATELKPGRAGGLEQPGRREVKTEDKDGAIAAFKRAIELDPNKAQFHFNLATVYRRHAQDRGRHPGVPGGRLAIRSSLAGAHYDLGILYSQQKRPTRTRWAPSRSTSQPAPRPTPPSRKDAEDRVKANEGAGRGKKK